MRHSRLLYSGPRLHLDCIGVGCVGVGETRLTSVPGQASSKVVYKGSPPRQVNLAPHPRALWRAESRRLRVHRSSSIARLIEGRRKPGDVTLLVHLDDGLRIA